MFPEKNIVARPTKSMILVATAAVVCTEKGIHEDVLRERKKEKILLAAGISWLYNLLNLLIFSK